MTLALPLAPVRTLTFLPPLPAAPLSGQSVMFLHAALSNSQHECAGEVADMSFTVKYAAPETIRAFRRGAETVKAHPSVDVWAFGMICFELLTHKPFYDIGTTADDVMDVLDSSSLLSSERELDPDIAGNCHRLAPQFWHPLRASWHCWPSVLQ